MFLEQLTEYNEQLAKAGRVADFLELGELFAKDALIREESAGGHFREESSNRRRGSKDELKNSNLFLLGNIKASQKMLFCIKKNWHTRI